VNYFIIYIFIINFKMLRKAVKTRHGFSTYMRKKYFIIIFKMKYFIIIFKMLCKAKEDV